MVRPVSAGLSIPGDRGTVRDKQCPSRVREVQSKVNNLLESVLSYTSSIVSEFVRLRLCVLNDKSVSLLYTQRRCYSTQDGRGSVDWCGGWGWVIYRVSSSSCHCLKHLG